MLKNNENLVELSKDRVWIYKKFISQEKINEINNYMSEWNDDNFDAEDHPLEFYKTRSGNIVPGIVDVWNEINKFLSPEWVSHPHLSLQRMLPGDEMFAHADSPGMGNEDMLTAPDVWSTCCIIEFGAVAYFGDFKGGEIWYPTIHSDGSPARAEIIEDPLVVIVEPGDLVIHSAFSDAIHGVKKVTSGIRYAYSNFILRKENNPGTFYSYGTEECVKRQEDLSLWGVPLVDNPRLAK